MWEQAATLAAADPAGAIDLLEGLVELTERAEIAALPDDQVRAAFEAVLSVDDRTLLARAKHLIHRVGERGGPDLHDLL